MPKSPLPLLAALLLSACASDINVAYPTPPSARDTGSILVRFTEPMRSVSILVDGVLVAEDEFTERVQISGVPVGTREVRSVASAAERTEPVDRTEAVEVTRGEQAVILIGTPPRSLGSWIERAASALVLGAMLIAGEVWR